MILLEYEEIAIFFVNDNTFWFVKVGRFMGELQNTLDQEK